jgi:hypothetical protein
MTANEGIGVPIVENETSTIEVGAEQRLPTAPAREDPDSLIVVGIGASAGGVQALQTFFMDAPNDSGMAFVVVLHLSPEHESYLAEILRRSTGMPVHQVTDRMKVEPNHVYVIPPAQHLAIEEGRLRLILQKEPRGQRVAVDVFLGTLAAAYGPRSVGVVMSGSGADGALGLKQIKEVGGLTLAQEPADAEQVLSRLITIEEEVESTDGKHYLARLLPYRTMEDKTDVVVLTFVDISARRKAEQDLERANDQMESQVVKRTQTLVRTNDKRIYLLRQLINAQEEERRRVSRELHDETAQDLTRLGVAGMQERAGLVGGTLTIESSPGQGTRVL